MSDGDFHFTTVTGPTFRAQLASDVLVALYASAKCEPEDTKHNAIVAVRAADALIEALGEQEPEAPKTNFKMTG